MLDILNLFYRLGLLNSYLISNKFGKHTMVKLSPFFYKRSSFYKKVRLISTPSKRFNIKLKSLKILTKSIGATTIILETSRGVMTHREALSLGVSGKILFVLS